LWPIWSLHESRGRLPTTLPCSSRWVWESQTSRSEWSFIRRLGNSALAASCRIPNGFLRDCAPPGSNQQSARRFNMEQAIKFIDRSGMASVGLNLIPAALIKKAQIDSEIERLANLPVPANGRHREYKNPPATNYDE